ncbi:homogentisate phytyltransferase [Oculatella sp. LEGE 06141]|uniref:homogentisate phytyltransferase n=1 Tax=Oculatella sp. LEGE 06141 TaxID=1828648 RepID=UPI00188084BB|nr:homogentisate phytyltransferase [Oculatella sp. LEGE 06141]MBE9177447.1 homogentisate phytyltransferase [Oculatella sp. LEGE 06141]
MSQISPKKSPVSSTDATQSNATPRLFSWLYALWKFSRPHTIIGTSLSVVGLAVVAIALRNGGLGADAALLSSHWVTIALAWITCLCGNVYIVGLNQLEDVSIDKVNKPHLPLASGEFSRREGWVIVAITGGLALLLPLFQGVFLIATVWSSLFIGTAYSLPPIRLKRFPFWASLCIFSVRGAIVNLGLFLHFNQRFQGEFQLPIAVLALTGFILVFTFAIAIFKDIPDLEGDRRYNITTFTIRLGKRAVFNLSRSVLTVCYLGVILAGAFIPRVHVGFLIVTHVLALGLLWGLSVRVNLQDKQAIARFYQFIWKLFFMEYLIFPLACLLASG